MHCECIGAPTTRARQTGQKVNMGLTHLPYICSRRLGDHLRCLFRPQQLWWAEQEALEERDSEKLDEMKKNTRTQVETEKVHTQVEEMAQTEQE